MRIRNNTMAPIHLVRNNLETHVIESIIRQEIIIEVPTGIPIRDDHSTIGGIGIHALIITRIQIAIGDMAIPNNGEDVKTSADRTRGVPRLQQGETRKTGKSNGGDHAAQFVITLITQQPLVFRTRRL